MSVGGACDCGQQALDKQVHDTQLDRNWHDLARCECCKGSLTLTCYLSFEVESSIFIPQIIVVN